MKEPDIPENETYRLSALHDLNILDTPAEERFDRLTRVAQRLFDVPIALVSLVDGDRQWFKSRQGVDVQQTPRNISFCGHAILDEDVFYIPDTFKDSRFADNPLVKEFPHIRMYAGVPLTIAEDIRIGTLCIIDHQPRHFDAELLEHLRDLAGCVRNELRQHALRDAVAALHDHDAYLQTVLDTVLDGIITIDDKGFIQHANPATEQTFGYPLEEILHQNVSMLMAGADGVQHDAYLQRYHETGKASIIGLGRQVTGQRKDGSTFPLELSVTEMQQSGKKYYVGLTRDISKRVETETRLLESGQRFERAVRGTSDGLWDWNVKQNTFWYAPRYRQLLGYDDKEFPNEFESWYSRLHPDDVEKTKAAIEMHLNENALYDVEYRLRTKSGNYRWFRARGEAVRDDQGEVTLMSGTIMDITRDKEAEAAIHKYANSLEQLHLITARTDLPFEEKIRELLKLGCQVFGLSLGIVSRIVDDEYTIEHVVGPPDTPITGTSYKLDQTCCSYTISANDAIGFHHISKSTIQVHPCYKKFGVEAYIGTPLRVNQVRCGTLCFSAPLPASQPFGPSDYSLIKLFAEWIGNEISRDQANSTLQKVTALRQAILDSADFSIISTDVNGTIVSFNRGAEQMLGYSAEEVVGKLTPAVFQDTEEVMRRASMLSAELGQPIEVGFEVWFARTRKGMVDESEWTYVRKNGSKFPVLLSNTTVCDVQGEISGFLSIGSDITVRKKSELTLIHAKEQAERNDRMKSEFINMMSHELRTPLTVILGYLPLLIHPDKLPNAEEICSITRDMQISGDHLLQLINDLLDISKIEAGKLALNIELCPVQAIVEGVIESFRQKAELKNIALHVDVDDSALYADPLRLRQILYNLVGNAVKFTDRGLINIIGIAATGGYQLQVSDTGMGIPSMELSGIFDKFHQVDSSSKRKAGGTGLGLAITRRLVELHKGTIHVSSQVGKGTQFTITMPKGGKP